MLEAQPVFRVLAPALIAALALATAAMAQGAPADDLVKPGEIIEFAADTMEYDDTGDLVTAKGGVVVERGGYRLRAASVVYDRQSGKVTATGDVLVVDPDGNQAFGDTVEVTENLRDAAIENILVVLTDGGRMAARRGTRVNGVTTLDRAVYSPCDVEGACGPKTPLWRIKAVRVIHDPRRGRLSYRGATLEFLGLPILYLPRFSHPDGGGKPAGGFLDFDLRYDRVLGLALTTPYYLPLADNNDLTVTPSIFSDTNPMLGLEYRHLFADGPIKFGGLVTYGPQFITSDGGVTRRAGDALRGYVYANGQLQHSSRWRSTFSIRAASDDTFLRRYDINQDDVLRSFYRLERFGPNSYLGVEGWAFQGLRPFDRGGETPIVLPLVDYRWRAPDRVLGGTIDLLANTLVLTRPGGEDTARALAQARWSRVFTTSLGQRITVTGQVRADAYHAQQTDRARLREYAGRDGWNGRIVPTGAIDIAWPLAGPALGGTQTLTPRVQFAASTFVANSLIPNEDARAIDLDDTNLFALNRFPGYDRVEGGPRVTYGFTWTLDRPRLRALAEIGQSYRLQDAPDLFPAGTGLTRDQSDVVGRTVVKFGRLVGLTHRFRLDQDALTIRRNEVDLTVGTNRSFAQLAYTRLNRNIAIEDLRDREEARVAARLQFARYWAVFGAGIVDLTSKGEDPFTPLDGYEPVRHRFGVAYDDECFAFSLTWRRDYISDRDNRSGDSFLVRVAFRNLGTR